jgi:hypothetical protein
MRALDGQGRQARRYHVVKFLLQAGADPNRVGVGRLTAMHAAAARGSAGILLLLLANGGALEPQSIEGRTPLHLAVMAGSRDCVDLLLTRGADPWFQDTSGGTAVEFAIQLEKAYGLGILDSVLACCVAPDLKRWRAVLDLAAHCSPQLRIKIVIWASKQDAASPRPNTLHQGGKPI